MGHSGRTRGEIKVIYKKKMRIYRKVTIIQRTEHRILRRERVEKVHNNKEVMADMDCRDGCTTDVQREGKKMNLMVEREGGFVNYGI